MIERKPFILNKKIALGTVFLVVLVDLLGFGIVLPLLPYYADKFNASAFAIGLLYSVYSLAQLVCSPLWGAISDRIGRRPIMLVSTLGSTISYILFALSGSFTTLLLSRLVGGIMGGNISTAQAYVADITSPEERSKGMGLLGAAFGIGFMLGPAIATLLIHSKIQNGLGFSGETYALPGFFAAALSSLSFCLVFFKLPETVGKNSLPDALRLARPNLLTLNFWRQLKEEQRASSHQGLALLFLCVFLSAFGQSSLYSAFPLFCKQALQLSAEAVGLQFAVMGLVAIIVQGGLIRHLTKRFNEINIFIVGFILLVLGLALTSLAQSSRDLYMDMGLMAFGASLITPILNSLVSKESAIDKMGQTLGSAQGLSALGRVLGPAWGGILFGFSTRLPFILTAFLLLLGIWAGLRLKRL